MNAPDGPRVSLTRSIAFSTGLSLESNGQPSRFLGPHVPSGGRRFLCEYTLSGRIHADTGMVLNITDLKAVLAEAVEWLERELDFERDPFAEDPVPTAEQLARRLWVQMSSRLPDGLRAERLRLWEDPTFCTEINRSDLAMTYVIRRYDFSAAHRLHSLGLSDADNARIFGKCNNPHGHGHNYGLDVTLRGALDPITGMAVDLAAVDAVVEDLVLSRLDHKHLNYDVPEFRDVNPTSENVAQAIWQWLRPALGPALVKVGLRETERNYFEVAVEDEA